MLKEREPDYAPWETYPVQLDNWHSKENANRLLDYHSRWILAGGAPRRFSWATQACKNVGSSLVYQTNTPITCQMETDSFFMNIACVTMVVGVSTSALHENRPKTIHHQNRSPKGPLRLLQKKNTTTNLVQYVCEPSVCQPVFGDNLEELSRRKRGAISRSVFHVHPIVTIEAHQCAWASPG